jgi:hypothetical protein
MVRVAQPMVSALQAVAPHLSVSLWQLAAVNFEYDTSSSKNTAHLNAEN